MLSSICMLLSIYSSIMYFLDVYPVMALFMHVFEKLFDAFGNSPIPNMLKASRAVIEKRKKELENGSANVRIICEHIILFVYADKLH